jgi:hypothetical protein
LSKAYPVDQLPLQITFSLRKSFDVAAAFNAAVAWLT